MRRAALPAALLASLLALACASEPVTDRPAQVVNPRPIPFPKHLRDQEVEGYAFVRYTIDAKGVVGDAEVVESEPEDTFDEIALRAVRDLRFRPKLAGGEPVPTRAAILLPFCNPVTRAPRGQRPEVCRGPRNHDAFLESIWTRHCAERPEECGGEPRVNDESQAAEPEGAR